MFLFFFFFSFLSKNVVLAVLGSLLSLVAAGGCHPLAVVCGLLVVAHGRSSGSRHAGFSGVAGGPSCPAARGIFLDRGPHLCPLRWQVGFDHWTPREVPFRPSDRCAAIAHCSGSLCSLQLVMVTTVHCTCWPSVSSSDVHVWFMSFASFCLDCLFFNSFGVTFSRC